MILVDIQLVGVVFVNVYVNNDLKSTLSSLGKNIKYISFKLRVTIIVSVISLFLFLINIVSN